MYSSIDLLFLLMATRVQEQPLLFQRQTVPHWDVICQPGSIEGTEDRRGEIQASDRELGPFD